MLDTIKRYLWKLLTYTRDYPTEDDKGKYCWLKTNRLHPTEHLCRIAKVEGEEPDRVVTLVNVEREELIEYTYSESRDKPWFCVWNRPIESPHIPALESEWKKSLIPTDIVGNLTTHKAIFWQPGENDEDVLEFLKEGCAYIQDGVLNIITDYHGDIGANSPVWIVKLQDSIFFMTDEDFKETFIQIPELM